MITAVLDTFAAAARDSSIGISQAAVLGQPVVRTLGVDAPIELIRASGAIPVRLTAGPDIETPKARQILGEAVMGRRGRQLLEQLVAAQHPVLITHADAIQPQLFAALRELVRLGERVLPRIQFVDLLHLDRPSSRNYNIQRLEETGNWLAEITGHRATTHDLERTIALVARQRELIRRVGELRRQSRPKLCGTDVLNIVAAAAVLTPEIHIGMLEQVLRSASELPDADGERVYLCGSPHEREGAYKIIESLGTLVVGEDHDWGEFFQTAVRTKTSELSDPSFRAVSRTVTPSARAGRIAEDAARCGARKIIHLTLEDDEAAPWDVAAIGRSTQLPLLALRLASDVDGELSKRVAHFLSGGGGAPEQVQKRTQTTSSNPRPSRPPAGARSRKSLQSLATFGAYQREWFASVRAAVETGAPFAVVNANAPQEILRAMEIPFVVNQWWASIVAAKQQSQRYLRILEDQNYPANVEAYSSQGLAAAFDTDDERAPWGGLPTPDFVHAVASSDPTVKIFDEWAAATCADCFIYERTIDPRWSISSEWWEDLPDRWDSTLESQRIDLMVAELQVVVDNLERTTGRRFSQARFEEIMNLVNEQEQYYRQTRDLIAASPAAPISIVDSMPATMVPQWHRGTKWARDAARAFYEEVLDRVDNGLAAAPNERIRLMWVGRGLWNDMGFYQKWEESHGAVFVWSMYLAIAADGYVRNFDRGRDPMRALAARFITMGDELRMPTWAGPWYVHEAKDHRIDGAIALRDADPFVVRALRSAGIPVLELPVDNFAREGEDARSVETAITGFIEGPASAGAEARNVAA